MRFISLFLMKKILYLIAVLFFSIHVLGQASESSVVSVRLPKGASSLTKRQLSGLVHQNFKRSSIPLERENYYQLDGILIFFWDLSVNPGFKKGIANSKLELLGYLSRNKDNTIDYSKIINVNGIQFLICQYENHGEAYLWFKSECNSDDKYINGVF